MSNNTPEFNLFRGYHETYTAIWASTTIWYLLGTTLIYLGSLSFSSFQLPGSFLPWFSVPESPSLYLSFSCSWALRLASSLALSAQLASPSSTVPIPADLFTELGGFEMPWYMSAVWGLGQVLFW